MSKSKIVLSLLLATSSLSYAKDMKELKTVTVTAQKQSENMQKVPISMSVFDEFDIEDKHIDSIEDIGSYVPNLMLFEIGDSTSTPPSIRGLFADALTLESTLGVYVDGIPMTMGLSMNDDLMDIERIEVLRGPQGTLYGKNTEAGAINIITKQPTNETRGKLSFSVGEDSLLNFGALASGPILKDKLYISVMAKHYEKDGFVKNMLTNKTVDDRKHNHAKVILRATPFENLDISFTKSLTKYDDDAASMGSNFLPDRLVSSDLEGKNTSKDDKNALKIIYDINEKVKLQSTSTYGKFNSKGKQDFDFTNNEKMKFHSHNDREYTKISQEFRLNFELEKLKLVSGVYFDKSKNKFDDFTDSFMPNSLKQTLEGKSLGLFLHTNYALTDDLGLIFGLRYDDETKSIKEEAKGVDLENDFNELSPKFSIQYNLLPNIMTYFTVAKGYRSGGFNPYAREGYPKKYDKESLWSYDLGFKSYLFDKNLILNANIYYMDISDMQVTANIKGDSSTFSETYTSNAAKATSKGIEVDLIGKITDEFSIFGGLGLNETKYKTFVDEIGDYSGNYNKFSPKYNFNLGIEYRNPYGIFAQIVTTGYGKMYLGKENKETQSRKAYELVNLKLGYESNSFDIYAYANNLFDKKYDAVGFASMFDTYSKPREIGLRVVYRF